MFSQGDYDLTVPFFGVKETARSIHYEDQYSFERLAGVPDNILPLLKDAAGKGYGVYIRAGRLMYARIFGAGHMINEKKARQAKHMLYTWLFKEQDFCC